LSAQAALNKVKEKGYNPIPYWKTARTGLFISAGGGINTAMEIL
jgi:hypothetical protein